MNLAVLIDADNVSYTNIKRILEEITREGVPTIRRIYGDWTKTTMKGWKTVLLENSIFPVQQYAYTIGKNATDSSLIIDAMDILHKENIDGFCIVSSDSDFTRLAGRLRESGKLVIGIGEQKTPMPFIAACNRFIYTEILNGEEEEGAVKLPEKRRAGRPRKNDPKATAGAAGAAGAAAPGATPAANGGTAVPAAEKRKESLLKVDGRLVKLLHSAVDDLGDDDGWAALGDVGNRIMRLKPDFDARNYGFSRFIQLMRSLGKEFELEERPIPGKGHKQFYVRSRAAEPR